MRSFLGLQQRMVRLEGKTLLFKL